MALISSLGYKEDSTPRRSNRNNELMNDYSSTPYGMQSNQSQQSHHFNNQSFNLPHPNQSQQFRNRSQSQNRQNPYNLSFNNNNQENDNFLSNNPSSRYNQNRSTTNSFLLNNNTQQNSPNRGKDSQQQLNRSQTQSNKYSSLPQQSIRSSGIGFVSPVPSKYQSIQNDSMLNDNNNNINNNNNNNFGISRDNLTHGDGQQSMGISPIKPSGSNDFNNDTLPLNQTVNTLNFSRQYGQESRLSLYNENQIKQPTQIMVIGFPSGEAQFIHRKFRTYGDILRSKWSENTLCLEYKHELQAKRALSQNTKWIKHENLNYMIAVTYAELTGGKDPFGDNNNNNDNMSLTLAGNNNDNDDNNGRYLNVTEMYNETFNNPDHNLPSYWGQNIDPIERQSVLQSGPTSNFWKVVHFLGSGW